MPAFKKLTDDDVTGLIVYLQNLSSRWDEDDLYIDPVKMPETPAWFADQSEKARHETSGRELFAQLCASCHGADAKGNGPAAEALVAPMPDLTMLAKDNDGVFPMSDVERAIRGERSVLAHGTGEMPMWGTAFEDVRPDFKPGQRRGFAHVRVMNLARYLESIQAE